jgi:CBS domain-containing protein
MKCSELMKTEIEVVAPSDTVLDAALRMRDRNIGFLPVCDGEMRVVGTLTDRDIAIRLVAEDRPADIAIEQVMSPNVVACRPDEELHAAEQFMAEQQVSRIMCVDEEGVLVGVLSLSDIALCDDAEHVADTLRRVSEREAPRSP